MTTEFSQMALHPHLVQAIADLGYTTPTPIQSAVISLMMAGSDIIGQAQTGTGKTAAFALPLLHNLVPGQKRTQALVLTPTRELAIQVADAVYQLGRLLEARVLAVYGGQPYSRQITRLNKGVDVVVGTPGRLLDLIERGVLDLGDLRTLVLDEADEMLSMGFIEDIEAILEATPLGRQTALFSATLPSPIRRLANRYLREPQSITIQFEGLAVATIEQRYYLVHEADKLAALTRIFEVEPVSRALVFVRTRAGTGELANSLVARGFPAESLNGDLSQETREQVMARFRNDQVQVLVATDVAARGLDVDGISHVINYDLPDDPELYVHRIGRTGRAGKAGASITLLHPKALWQLRRIEGFIKQSIVPTALPTVEEIMQFRENKLLEQVNAWLASGRCQQEGLLVAKLVEAGHDPLDIAAAGLKLARAEEKQRPILPIRAAVEAAPRKGKRPGGTEGKKRFEGDRQSKVSHEPGMVRLSLSRGKMHGIRPNDVVSAIAYFADIPGKTIGKIYIQEKQTLVDIPEEYVAQVMAKAGSFRIRKQTVAVEQV